MADFQPPPTWALPILVDEDTKRVEFNPVWLKWFVDLVGIINDSGGGTGTIQHNSTGSLQGGAANQYYHLTLAQLASLAAIIPQETIIGTLASGTYTPTLTNVTNLTASTAYECQYMRVGNTVTVSGKVEIDPTAAAAIELGISLPIASNFGTQQDCGGVAAPSTIADRASAILADSTNDRASLQGIVADTTNHSLYFTFTYQVI